MVYVLFVENWFPRMAGKVLGFCRYVPATCKVSLFFFPIKWLTLQIGFEFLLCGLTGIRQQASVRKVSEFFNVILASAIVINNMCLVNGGLDIDNGRNS